MNKNVFFAGIAALSIFLLIAGITGPVKTKRSPTSITVETCMETGEPEACEISPTLPSEIEVPDYSIDDEIDEITHFWEE